MKWFGVKVIKQQSNFFSLYVTCLKIDLRYNIGFFFLLSNLYLYITYSEPNKCKLVSLIQPDIKGMLPKNVVESAIPGSMVEFFTKLEEALKKDGKISSWGARNMVREGSGEGTVTCCVYLCCFPAIWDRVEVLRCTFCSGIKSAMNKGLQQQRFLMLNMFMVWLHIIHYVFDPYLDLICF